MEGGLRGVAWQEEARVGRSSRGPLCFDFLPTAQILFLSTLPAAATLPRQLRQHLPRCTAFAPHLFSPPASPLNPLHSSYRCAADRCSRLRGPTQQKLPQELRQAQSSKAPLDRPYCGSSAHHPVTHMRLPPFPAPTPARALRPAHSITDHRSAPPQSLVRQHCICCHPINTTRLPFMY